MLGITMWNRIRKGGVEMVDSLVNVLMKRDGLSKEEAEQQIEEAREILFERLDEGEMPFDICEEFFGLEPDYLMDLV
jgi:ribosomal protein S7